MGWIITILLLFALFSQANKGLPGCNVKPQSNTPKPKIKPAHQRRK